MKKVTSLLLSLLIIISIMCNLDTTAGAANTVTQTVAQSHLKTVFNVANHVDEDGVISTNIGGISVGAAYNRLFVVKSNKYEVISTLYYYNNIYDARFKTGAKKPKRIVFDDGLLGHANAMAVDDNYIYVTQWQKKDKGEKSAVIQISRKAISLLSSGSVVSNTKKTVKDSAGNTIPIYKVYKPTYTDGTAYTSSISAITRYSYDKANNVTKFLISHSFLNKRTVLNYTIATLKDGKFTVSESVDDMFTVNNPYPSVTMQDIFYDASYGLLIPMWLGVNSNKLLCVDIRKLKEQGKTEMLKLDPYKILTVEKNEDANGTLNKYEMESIAFVKRDENYNSTNFRLIFSCNKADAEDKGCDSIEEITPLSTYLNKF